MNALCRLRTPRLVATLVGFVSGLALLALVSWFVTHQLLTRISQIDSRLEAGIAQVRSWLMDGPLDLTASQIEQVVSPGRRRGREQDHQDGGRMRRLRAAVRLGPERSPDQDVGLGLRQLVDSAERASA